MRCLHGGIGIVRIKAEKSSFEETKESVLNCVRVGLMVFCLYHLLFYFFSNVIIFLFLY